MQKNVQDLDWTSPETVADLLLGRLTVDSKALGQTVLRCQYDGSQLEAMNTALQAQVDALFALEGGDASARERLRGRLLDQVEQIMSLCVQLGFSWGCRTGGFSLDSPAES